MSAIGRAAVVLAFLLAPMPAVAADPFEQLHIPPAGFATTHRQLKAGVTKHSGTARWTVKGRHTKAVNPLAKRVAKRCPQAGRRLRDPPRDGPDDRPG